MKRKWKYLLGGFLLATGLLLGCAEESGQVPQRIQVEKSQGTENQETEEGMPEAGNSEKFQELEQAGTGTEDTRFSETDEEGTEALEMSDSSETQEVLDIPLETEIIEDGVYTSKEEVAEYIFLYGHLPDNFITKKEATALGWVSSKGNLGEVAPGKSIGGDYFGNFEGNLPEKKGRNYHECDIDSSGGYRGAKRIVYSNDGLIYYTEDHYETFELLYGEE